MPALGECVGQQPHRCASASARARGYAFAGALRVRSKPALSRSAEVDGEQADITRRSSAHQAELHKWPSKMGDRASYKHNDDLTIRA